MPLEPVVNWFSDFDINQPQDGDYLVEGDNHIRNVKKAIDAQLSSLGDNALTATALEINEVTDGDTAATSTVIADTDQCVINDNGVMVQAVMTDLRDYMIDKLHPVGSIYTSTSSTNPATLLGFGTWAAFGQGKFLISADATYTSEGTGGSTDAIVVQHQHSAGGLYTDTDSHYHTLNKQMSIQLSGGTYYYQGTNAANGLASQTTDSDVHDHTVLGTTANAGASGANANMPPYIGVHMWKRTA